MHFRDILLMSAVAPRGAWKPEMLGSTLAAGWDASRSDLITLETGSKVSSWKDIVGGYDLVQGTDANRPVFSLTGFNGFPVVTGDGVSSELTLAPAPAGIPIGANPSEWWWLVDQQVLATDSAVKSIGGIGNSGGGNTRQLRRIVSTLNRARGDDTNATPRNSNIDFSGRHVVRMIATGSQVGIDVDGDIGTTESVVSAIAGTRIRFFASPVNTASAWCAVGIAACYVTNGLLSTDQAAQMYAFLNRRR